tara:strand:- start:1667 stop:2380 length:714 start_codon:yes stop_codon:yes gene_type:complete
LKYSIIIPVLNEEKNLVKIIPEIFTRLKKINFELIIVDDNSTDNTSKIFKRFKNKKIRYFLRKNDRDLSRACIYGFDRSKNENIVVMDGDYQHKPKDLLKLINVFEKKNIDILVGARNLFIKKNKGLGFIRLNASRILVLIVNILFGKKTSDPMSGFFIFKKKIYNKSKKELLKNGYKILLDLIYTSEYSKKKVIDVYINFDDRKKGKSKMSFKIILKLLKMIIFKFYLLRIKTLIS